LILAFVYYAYVIAPKKMLEKARKIALDQFESEKIEEKRRSLLTPEQRMNEDREIELELRKAVDRKNARNQADIEAALERTYGWHVPALICPHCQSKGLVRRKDVTRVTKTRVKSLAARAVGLGTNTENQVQQLRCDRCASTWDIS
jgi:excinuclease UvrABC ATPase subunit